MFDVAQGFMYTKEQLAEMKKAEKIRQRRIAWSHVAIFVGYALLIDAFLHGLLAYAVFFIAFGLHGLIIDKIWKDWK